MEGLTKKIMADGEAEQDLYDKFKCWCTKVINAKTTSMAANEARIDELAQYIDDLTSGRVELTSERQELEAEIAGLEKAVEEETTMRDKEHEDFLAAKDEMDKAIAALKSAVYVLGNGTAEEPTMLVAKLQRVLKVGQGFLAKQDVSALHKLLDVPEVDWKKLNREATFKQKYEARSGNIQDILKDMLTTFTDNLESAQAAEDKAASDFDALMEAKKSQLSTAKQALIDKEGEKGARGEALAVSEEEKRDLEAQNERDEQYLADTKATCETRASEWQERKKLRAGEIAAINEAISILRSDDARDTFKKSFDSQGLFFTQTNEVRHSHRHRGVGKQVLSLIRTLGKTTQDLRLTKLISVLADRVEQGPKEEGPPGTEAPPGEEIDEANPFVQVIALIDEVIAELDSEGETDITNKEQCEKERMENTQQAKVVSKEIDTNVETMDRLTDQILAANKTVQEIIAEIEDLEEAKREAGENRANENKEYLAAEADDTAAVGLIENAMGVLQTFYQENGLMLAQVRRVKQPFVEAGEAPTPPPSTWEGEYGGAKGESTGIIAIMELIKADIEKDIEKAKSQEAASVEAYDKLCADIDAAVGSKMQTKGDLEASIAADEGERSAENSTKATNEGELASIMDYLKEIAPGCDFIAMHFTMRVTNRQLEKDGLLKAKAILQGAKFD
jgi:hypothetical protein